MWQAIAQQLSDTLMFQYDITEKTKINGGDIHECYMISDGSERYFIKLNQREFLPQYELEAENLRMMRESSTVFVPELILVGTSKSHAFIILNYLPTKPLDDAANSFKFGVQLAQLHQWGIKKSTGSMSITTSVTLFSPISGPKNGTIFLLNSVSAGSCSC